MRSTFGGEPEGAAPRLPVVLSVVTFELTLWLDLPDNTEVELAEVAGNDTLSDEDDRDLAEILAESDVQIARGEEGIPVEEVIERLRARGRHEEREPFPRVGVDDLEHSR